MKSPKPNTNSTQRNLSQYKVFPINHFICRIWKASYGLTHIIAVVTDSVLNRFSKAPNEILQRHLQVINQTQSSATEIKMQKTVIRWNLYLWKDCRKIIKIFESKYFIIGDEGNQVRHLRDGLGDPLSWGTAKTYHEINIKFFFEMVEFMLVINVGDKSFKKVSRQKRCHQHRCWNECFCGIAEYRLKTLIQRRFLFSSERFRNRTFPAW